MISALSSEMELLDEQLADGRDWLFDTEQLSYGDISLFYFYGWYHRVRKAAAVFDAKKFPHAMQVGGFFYHPAVWS